MANGTLRRWGRVDPPAKGGRGTARLGPRLGLLLCLLAVLVAGLDSCTTFPYYPGEATIDRLLAALDSGDYARNGGLAAAPFVLDGEILLLQSDLDAFWTGLEASGFRFGEARLLGVVPVDGQSFRLFAPGMEIKTFFAKRLGPGSSVATIATGAGRFLLVVERGKGGLPLLRGFAGPLR